MGEHCVGLSSPAASWSMSIREEVLILPALLGKSSARKVTNILKHLQAESESLSGKRVGGEHCWRKGAGWFGWAGLYGQQECVGWELLQSGWLQRKNIPQQHVYLFLQVWILLSDSPPKEQGLQATRRADGIICSDVSIQQAFPRQEKSKNKIFTNWSCKNRWEAYAISSFAMKIR